jgi:hypothetical protein
MADLSRKDFLKKLGLAGVAGVGATSFLAACGGGSSEEGSGSSASKSSGAATCNDTSGLTDAEKKLREDTFKYVNETPNPEKNCENCQFYKTPAAGAQCGGCTLFKGPVAPGGYCNSWAEKMG